MSTEIFLSLPGYKKDIILKQRLAKIEAEMSRDQYTAFLRSFYQSYNEEKQSNKFADKDNNLARKLLFRWIMEAESSLVDMKLERASHYKNALQQRYNSLVEKIIRCYSGVKGGESNLKVDGNHKGAKEGRGPCPSHLDHLGDSLKTMTIEKMKYHTAKEEDPTVGQSSCLFQTVAREEAKDEDPIITSHSDLGHTLEAIAENKTTRNETQHEYDAKKAASVQKILEGLEYGSLTGLLKMVVNGETWKVPNVVHRDNYRFLLLAAVTDDLPILDPGKVGSFLDSVERDGCTNPTSGVTEGPVSDWILDKQININIPTSGYGGTIYDRVAESPVTFLNVLSGME